jgi:polar amino acid transport system permease protein
MRNELFSFLLTWTPYLLGGFVWNVVIGVVAVCLGTSIGAGLAWVRITQTGRWLSLGEALTKFFCNVPTLAIMFYAAYMLPKEFTVPTTAWVITIPAWVKAAIGLSASTAGFTAVSLMVAHKQWFDGKPNAAMLFIPTWANSVMISFVASSTASLIGVSEIVSRCNFLIGATGTSVMIPLYLYCSAYFVMTCMLWMYLVKRVRNSDYLLTWSIRRSTLQRSVVSPVVGPL